MALGVPLKKLPLLCGLQFLRALLDFKTFLGSCRESSWAFPISNEYTLRKAFLDRKFCTLFSKDSKQAFSVHTFLLFDGKQHPNYIPVPWMLKSPLTSVLNEFNPCFTGL